MESMEVAESRIASLEVAAEKVVDRLAAIETRLTILETRANTFATKEDLARAEGQLQAKIAEAKSGIVMWVVGTMLTLGSLQAAAIYFIARNVH